MSSGSDFLQLDPTTVRRGERAGWLAERIRSAAAEGTLAVGSRLPPTRTLAADLGFARGTVAEAYRRLTEEGLLSTNRGGGTMLMARPAQPDTVQSDTMQSDTVQSDTVRAEPGTPDDSPTLIDLATGVPDLTAFPRSAWLRAERAVLQSADARRLGYAPPHGVPELREQLARWLATSRGVHTSAAGIVITGGVTGALSLLHQVTAEDRSDPVALEDPGADGNRRILRHWRRQLIGIPVDEDGIRVDRLAATSARSVVVTPAHQYPTGVVLSAERRHQLISWASAHDGLIIEDDYDAEYRYDRTPVRAMQPLAPDRIAYTSSLSKTLAPALRLGWLVPPPAMLDAVIEKRWAIDLGSPALAQLTLAELLRSGLLERHLRSMRQRHRRRRDAAVAAITEALPGCPIRGVAAGLQLVVDLPDGVDDQAVADRARDRGVLVQPLTRHRIAAGSPGLIISYADQSPARIRDGVRTLGALLAAS